MSNTESHTVLSGSWIRVAAAILVLLLAAPARADQLDDIVAGLESGEPSRMLAAMLAAHLYTAIDVEGLRTRTVGPLRKALSSDHLLVRQQAADLLGTLRAEEAWDDLAALLDDPGDGPRSRALDSLGRIADGDSKRIAPLAAKGLVDPSWLVRTAAAEIFTEMREIPEELIPDLGCLAAAAVGSMGESGAPASPALLRALRSDAVRLRAAAARALGAVGPKARSAIPTLEKLAERDAAGEVREAAKEALEKIRTE